MKTPANRVCLGVVTSLEGMGLAVRLAAMAGLLAACCLTGAARAQDAQEPPPAPEAGKTAPDLEKPVDVERVTGDGLVVHATYFASSRGKEAVPVILLHSWKSDGLKDFDELAAYLQAQGYAVLVPDLRGHGSSTTFKLTGAQLDPARMGNGDVASMVINDMEAWRGFLVQENNDNRLNLNALCMVGSEMGASVAMHWALRDWNWLVWSAGKRKPSVKALVLISPQKNFRGLDIREPLANPVVRGQLSVMILVGKQDAKAYAQAHSLETMLAKYHPQPPGGLDEKAQAAWDIENRDLFFRSFDTKLQGSKLIGVRQLMTPWIVARFIDLRLVRKIKDFPWQEVGKKG